MTKPADSEQIAKARAWLLRLIIAEGKKDHRFLHSFYALGSKDQILGSYGKAIIEDFEQTIKLSEVAEYMTAFAASERQAVIEECAKVADNITIYTNDDCSRVRNRIVTAIRSME